MHKITLITLAAVAGLCLLYFVINTAEAYARGAVQHPAAVTITNH